MHTFYHGSPVAGLKTLRAGSFISPDLETARLMGMFYTDTGKTWTDEDLADKHKFGQPPKWKEGREPTGKPNLYQLTVDALDNIDLLDNPYEHTIKQEMPVTPYNDELRAVISNAVKQVQKQAAGWWPFGGQTTAAPKPAFKTLAPLNSPPAAPPKLPEVPPKQIADQVFPGDPPATLGQHIGRWYTNTGGLDKAINSAQQAQQNRNPQVLSEAAWPKWQPSDVTQRTAPVRVSNDLVTANGIWNPANPALGAPNPLVRVQPQWGFQQGANGKWREAPKTDAQGNLIPYQPTLEHELSHNSYIRDKAVLDAQRAAQNNPVENTVPDYRPNFGPRLLAKDEETRKYVLNPAEIDARLAEVKRRYAHYTGKLVETPEHAQEAWNWWRENSPRLHGESVELPGDPDINQKSTSFYDQGNKNPFGTGSVRPIREWWDKQYNRGPAQNWEEERPTLSPDQFKLYDALPDANKQQLFQRMPELVKTNPPLQKFGAAMARTVVAATMAPTFAGCQFDVKSAELRPEITLQPHQQRVADRVSGPNPRMLVYHGLGTGKSLAAIAAAEAAKKNSGGEYAIVAPASLRDNFRKEIDKFTTGAHPDILSYTGLGLGQQPKNNPETLIFDEAHRLRNPEGLAAQAATEAAQKAQRVVLLTGAPITNEPNDLANIMSILRNEKITPEIFENKYVQYKKVKPGWGGWLRGVKPGEEADVKNPEELKAKLRGHVDFNPGKSPDGVDIQQQIIDAPMTAEQERIQKAIRTKIPPRFLWKLDKEFPLSRDELAKLNSFLTGMRQISLSTQPFRADKDHFKAFEQSGKLQTAMTKLRETLDSDPRKKALIYSNYIDAGLQPYAAALAKNKIPHAIFHGGIPLTERRKALDEYNAGKLKALLIGPAGAEGISTKGTSLIQLLDPHWNETRSQQAQGRGLRFDSHMDLPEELKNVAVQRFISRAKDPGWFKKHVLGAQKVRTGDEILDTLAKEKEKANDKFRAILKQVGSESAQEETARRMYEENVPEEQQRKAAASAWAGMTR
jgi:superfamily II DNA or RNA helicase